MFDRIVSVDWSGADNVMKRVDLRVAAFDAATNQLRIVNPPFGTRPRASWSRREFQTWIVHQLQDKTPTLVAMDFGFGLPWGSDKIVFGASGWHDMVRAIAERYAEKGTARETAKAINAEARFGGHGPYRFDRPDRNDFRFYSDKGVAYYRLTELIAPQAMSQWYCGSGAKVSFHTFSGKFASRFRAAWKAAAIFRVDAEFGRLQPCGASNGGTTGRAPAAGYWQRC